MNNPNSNIGESKCSKKNRLPDSVQNVKPLKQAPSRKLVPAFLEVIPAMILNNRRPLAALQP
jgi:hypothetical protein